MPQARRSFIKMTPSRPNGSLAAAPVCQENTYQIFAIVVADVVPSKRRGFDINVEGYNVHSRPRSMAGESGRRWYYHSGGRRAGRL